MNRNEICFIRPKIDENDYYYKAIEKMGYPIFEPYYGNHLVGRIMREIWFRLGIPKCEIWYNKKISKNRSEVFIVRDSLITPRFLEWLRDNHKHSRIIMDYDNIVRDTLSPELIKDKSIELWSYDLDDCNKYSMNIKPQSFLDLYRIRDDEKKDAVYDVLYLGRDKGRINTLKELEKQLRELGLNTYFHICPNRRFQIFFNRDYKKLLTYFEYMDLMKISKSVLNIVNKPQASMTMRDMEVVFNGIKGITNNIKAVEFPLYDSSRFFVLGLDPIEKLTEFLNTPFKKIQEEELEQYTYEYAIKKMVNKTRN